MTQPAHRTPQETTPPAGSAVASLLPGASFSDAWSIESDWPQRSALDHYLAAAQRTPGWVEALMKLRNRAVRLVGLKDLGTLSALATDKPTTAYAPGDRVGIFTLRQVTFDEVLLGDDDKHLNVVVSVHRRPVANGDTSRVLITVTTVVHVKNALGRLYMLPVKPMHRLIAPTVLAAMVARA